jgi:hypothetical protein
MQQDAGRLQATVFRDTKQDAPRCDNRKESSRRWLDLPAAAGYIHRSPGAAMPRKLMILFNLAATLVYFIRSGRKDS